MSDKLDLLRIVSLVGDAICEDVGEGDRTTESVIPKDAHCAAEIVLNEDGVVAGLPIAHFIFECFSSDITFEILVEEGAKVSAGTKLASLTGSARPILTAERTALNFLQHISAVATLTRRCVDAIEGSGAIIMDTRKTTPAWRYLDKYAVRAGGGTNHRMGLYDQVLIKENHLRAAGGGLGAIGKAVSQARQSAPKGCEIEVEVETLEQARDAAEAGADIIMLDNMDAEAIKKAVKSVKSAQPPEGRKRPQLEVSGGIALDALPKIASLGVDRISLGMITHSAPALDISMEIAGRTN